MSWLLLWPLWLTLLAVAGALIWRWRSGARGVPMERQPPTMDEVIVDTQLRDGPNGALNGPFR